MLWRGEPDRCQPEWKCCQWILVCPSSSSDPPKRLSGPCGLSNPSRRSLSSRDVLKHSQWKPPKSHIWQSNPVSVNSWVMEDWGLPCWLVLVPSPQRVTAQKVLWVLPHLGSLKTWWKQHLGRCGGVWLLCAGRALVTAAATLSPAWLQDCRRSFLGCRSAEPPLSSALRVLLPPGAGAQSCALQSPAASPPLHSPWHALLYWASMTSLSCGRGGHLVGPYLASWSSTFHTLSWRQERRYLEIFEVRKHFLCVSYLCCIPQYWMSKGVGIFHLNMHYQVGFFILSCSCLLECFFPLLCFSTWWHFMTESL